MSKRDDSTEQILSSLNEPVEQRDNYPCLDRYLDEIDVTATDLMHGWYPGIRDEAYAAPFRRAFGVVVLRYRQEVLHRIEESGEPPYCWESAGRIEQWIVSPELEIQSTPSYLAGGISSVVDLYPASAEGFCDEAGVLRFRRAIEALRFSYDLAGVADEHGIGGAIWIGSVMAGQPGEDTTEPGRQAVRILTPRHARR